MSPYLVHRAFVVYRLTLSKASLKSNMISVCLLGVIFRAMSSVSHTSNLSRGIRSNNCIHDTIFQISGTYVSILQSFRDSAL